MHGSPPSTAPPTWHFPAYLNNTHWQPSTAAVSTNARPSARRRLHSHPVTLNQFSKGQMPSPTQPKHSNLVAWCAPVANPGACNSCCVAQESTQQSEVSHSRTAPGRRQTLVHMETCPQPRNNRCWGPSTWAGLLPHLALLHAVTTGCVCHHL